jgi:hypothetical protein
MRLPCWDASARNAECTACAVLRRNRRASESSSDELESFLEEFGRFLALYALLARAAVPDAFATLAVFFLCLLIREGPASLEESGRL